MASADPTVDELAERVAARLRHQDFFRLLVLGLEGGRPAPSLPISATATSITVMRPEAAAALANIRRAARFFVPVGIMITTQARVAMTGARRLLPSGRPRGSRHDTRGSPDDPDEPDPPGLAARLSRALARPLERGRR